MHVTNNIVHTSTKHTPFLILYGFYFGMPSNLKRKCSPLYNAEDPSKVLKFQIQRVHKLVKENQKNAKESSKKYYDNTSYPVVFKTEHRVLVGNQNTKNKFSPIWRDHKK